MSNIIPNSFQTPNLYIDRLMPLLTDTELRILIYMTRRIFGFHKQQDRISLSQFTDGIVSEKTGNRLDYGAGVGRSTARIALEKLASVKIITMTQPHDRAKNLPAEWSLQLDDTAIDWATLEERKRASDEASEARSAKQKANQPDNDTPISVVDIGGAVSTTDTALYQPLAQPYISQQHRAISANGTHNNQRKQRGNKEETKRGGEQLTGQQPAQPAPPPLVLPEELPEPAVKLPKILSARTDPLADARSKALQALAKACPVFDAPMGFVTRLNAEQCNLLIDWCAKAACNQTWATSKGSKLPGLLRSMVERGESAEVTAKDIDRLWELIEIDRHYDQAQALAAAAEEKPPAPVGPSVNLDPPDKHQTQWTTLLSELERSMQPEAFREFLLDSYPVRVDGNSWLIGVPSSKSMQWLQNRMLPKLQRSLSGMVGQRVEVAFCLQ